MGSRTIALLGLRCSGKTSVGRALARRLALPFVDLDLDLCALARERHETHTTGEPTRAALQAGDWLARLGEPAFRDLEELALERTLERPTPCVLATGGGVVERASNRTRLATVTCVWLAVAPHELARRMRADPTPRPALAGGDPVGEIELLHARRAPLYAALAAHEVDGGRPAEDVARELAALLASTARDPGGRPPV